MSNILSGHENLPKGEATNSASPIEPVKDSEVIISRERIAEIMRDNISFSAGSYMIYGAIDPLIELFKEWHNKLSSPPEPVKDAIELMSKSIKCLALELPKQVWEDISANWQAVLNQLSSPPDPASKEQENDAVGRLNKIIEIKEAERKEWADMCIKKQNLIEVCRMALEEIFNKETDPITAAGGALLFLNSKKPDKETIEWAEKVIEKHKNSNQNHD